ncbi:MAG: ComEC family competence protein [Lachnospiraceae bacterium]|nr:ComEC family competence protein [Lachnospiraceae bacterium]
MKRRPAACVALALFLLLLLLPVGLLKESPPITQKQTGRIEGRVARWTIKDEGMQLNLVNCRIQAGGTSVHADQILVYLSGAADYPVGADLSLSGTIYPVETPTNPGQFDSSLYYGAKGISCTVFAENAQILALHPAPLRENLLQLKKRLGEVYDALFSEEDAGVLRAMVLGEKSALDSDTKNLYQKNGISHLLAISGLHISLIGMGLYRILRRLTGYYLPAGIFSILLIAAYGWMAGAALSALRAVIMCVLMVAADLVGRSYDMLTAMGIAAIALLLPSPLNSRQSAFLLSFGAVLGIALLLPVLRLYRPKQGRLFQALGVSLSVLAVTFPVLLCAFSEYSLYSVLLNLLVIPLMSVLMTAAIFCGLAGLLLPGAARIPALPCRLILLFYRRMGELCLKLPGSVLSIGTPERWKNALNYSMVGVA